MPQPLCIPRLTRLRHLEEIEAHACQKALRTVLNDPLFFVTFLLLFLDLLPRGPQQGRQVAAIG